MRSHFRINGRAAMACAVAGAATMFSGHCAAQSFIAADYSTNSIYNSGWSAGQNGGNGFGAWGFDSTDQGSLPGIMQSMSTASALGTAWTLMDTTSTDGISDTGRAILEPGGLQVGQTFQTTIQNPTAFHFFRGFDILFTSSSTNNPGGDNAAAIRISVFQYGSINWVITDMSGSSNTGVSPVTTGASGVIFALTLTSTNAYTLTMAPANNPTNLYTTYSGTIAGTNLPISYVNYRLWNTASSGTNDVTDNFEISSMTIQAPPPVTLNIQPAGANVVLSWSTNDTNFVLASSPSLSNGSVWSTNLPAPVVNGNLNFVTNPVSGKQQFFRLQSP